MPLEFYLYTFLACKWNIVPLSICSGITIDCDKFEIIYLMQDLKNGMEWDTFIGWASKMSGY